MYLSVIVGLCVYGYHLYIQLLLQTKPEIVLHSLPHVSQLTIVSSLITLKTVFPAIIVMIILCQVSDYCTCKLLWLVVGCSSHSINITTAVVTEHMKILPADFSRCENSH